MQGFITSSSLIPELSKKPGLFHWPPAAGVLAKPPPRVSLASTPLGRRQGLFAWAFILKCK